MVQTRMEREFDTSRARSRLSPIMAMGTMTSMPRQQCSDDAERFPHGDGGPWDGFPAVQARGCRQLIESEEALGRGEPLVLPGLQPELQKTPTLATLEACQADASPVAPTPLWLSQAWGRIR